jgi:uncharacterized protein YhbP (UPF0306 family)
MNDDALRERVQGYLRAHHVMTLATCGAAGPWAAALFYVHEGSTLFFLSSPNSRHAQDLELDPRVAVAIQDNVAEWSQIQGLQIEGHARRLGGNEEARARALYAARFPLIGALAQAPAALRDAFARVRWYAVTARRVRWIDNSLGFGHRDELDLGP